MAIIKAGENNSKKESEPEQFPANNPNPFLRIGNDGSILYANIAALSMLENGKAEAGEEILLAIQNIIKNATLREKIQKFEVDVGIRKYLLSYHPLPKKGYSNIYGFDITSQKETEQKLRIQEKQHVALYELGKISLTCPDLQALLDKSTAIIAHALEVEYCKILELLSDDNFLLRAGTGWKPGFVGTAIVEGDQNSQAGYTLKSNAPVIVNDIRSETRFHAPQILKEHGIISGMSVIIGNLEKPFGVLGVHTTVRREFTKQDIYFLDCVAFVIAKTIENKNAEEELRLHRDHLEQLVRERTLELTKANEMLQQEISERKEVEKTLQKSEEKFRIAVEQTGQIVFDYDPATDGIDWAGAIPELTGYSSEEIQKFTPTDWVNNIHQEDRERYLEAINSSIIIGKRLQEEYRFERKDGNYIFVEDCGVPLKDENGCINRVLGVKKDITEKKLAMEKLQKSEETFRIAVEQTGQIVFDYDPATGAIDWAGAIPELTGYSNEEIQKFTPRTWKEHVHPEDRERMNAALIKSITTGEKFQEEYRFRRKEGSYLFLEDSRRYLKDKQGRIYRGIGVVKDITANKLSVERVRKSEELYRSFLQNSMGIAFQINSDLSPMFLHGAVEKITGYKEEDFLLGTPGWTRILEPEYLPQFAKNMEKLLAKPDTLIEHEYIIRRRDGKRRWVHEIIQNISDEAGKIILLQGSIHDITERKIAEETVLKAEEMRKKEIHHRIKNNLQVISSLLNLQAEKFNDKEIIDAFKESQNRVISMALIHEELYKSGDVSTLDFGAYLKKLTAALLQSYKVGKAEIGLTLKIEEIFLNMDIAIPLGIIVNELVSNALKHAFPSDREGEIYIELLRTGNNELNGNELNSIINEEKKTENNSNLNQIDKNNSKFILIVEDNGVGFPSGFDFRNTSSLGLQLVNTLVEQIEGSIELKSKDGTEFRIEFKENEMN